MAYDEDLADRIRELVSTDAALTGKKLTEKKMFGGLAFLIGGHMAIAASGQGGVLVRVDPAKTAEFTKSGKAEVAVMRGREMSGWLRVATEDLKTKRDLSKWVERGVGYAGSLPAKR